MYPSSSWVNEVAIEYYRAALDVYGDEDTCNKQNLTR